MKRALKILSLVMVGIALAMPTLPLAAIESFGVGGRPANPQKDNPRTNSIFVYELEPGETKEDGIRVISSNPDTRKISIYATDSQISSDGAFACEQAVEPKDDVGSWIKLDKNSVTLDQGDEETINFTVTVPENTGVGEHNGCIAIQDMTNTTEADENGIALSFRSALRVAITIPGEVISDLKLNSVNIADQKDNKMIVTPEYTNSGNVSVDAKLDASLGGLFGIGNRNSGGEFPVLRDSSARFNFEMDKPFWGGWYKLSVTGSYKPLSQAEAERKNLEDYTKTLFIAPHPIALLVEIAAVLLVLGLIAWIVLRRRKKQQQLKYSHSYTVVPGDTIQSIAQDAGVSWKTLAKLNNVKPPYSLTPGASLRVPQTKAGTKSES